MNGRMRYFSVPVQIFVCGLSLVSCAERSVLTSTGTSAGAEGSGSTDTSAAGTGGTTMGASSSTMGASSSTAGATSTMGATGEPGLTSTGRASMDPTTAGNAESSGATDGETTSGGLPVGCAVDADCMLHSDCCTCEGVPIGEDVAACEMECKQARCSEFGVDQAVCRFGVCTTERLSCDTSMLGCDAVPPVCPPGNFAETSSGCWTGKCVPAVLCDVVPKCALCPEGTLCVKKSPVGLNVWPSCEPIPVACGGEVTCNCIGDLVCTGAYTACSVQDSVVSCKCADC